MAVRGGLVDRICVHGIPLLCSVYSYFTRILPRIEHKLGLLVLIILLAPVWTR